MGASWARFARRLGIAPEVASRVSRAFLRTARDWHDAHGVVARTLFGTRCLSNRSFARGVEVHWRNREESREDLRAGGRPRLDIVFRRGRCALWQADAGS